MSNIELVFDRPWLLLLILPLAAVIVVPYLYLARNKLSFRSLAPVILHFLSALAVVFIISGFSIIESSNIKSVMILLDMSESCAPQRQEMTEKANSILASATDNVNVGVVLFGKEAKTVIELTDSDKARLSPEMLADADVGGDETDILSAMNYAVSAMPESKNKQIIILSDGNETVNNSLELAMQLSALGVRVDALSFSSQNGGNEIQLSAVSCPEIVTSGEEAHAVLSIESSCDASVNIIIRESKKAVVQATENISAGTNLIPFSIIKNNNGTYYFDVIIEPADPDNDTIQQNNTGAFSFSVTGRPSVLLISDSEAYTDSLAEILSEKYEVSVVNGWSAPKTLPGMMEYDQIVLFHANVNDMPTSFINSLDLYIKDKGKSVITLMGSTSYWPTGAYGGAFPDMLPYTFDYKRSESQEAVALTLILDCSRSMGQIGSRLELAKLAAMECVDNLSENDSVEIIKFSSTASVVTPMMKATRENKALISEQIELIATQAGTDYTPAFTLAAEELKNCTDKKFVIFLSDGEPKDAGFYTSLEALRDTGAVISSIGLGYSSNYIYDIASLGGGRDYYADTAYELPQILLTESMLVTNNPFVVGEIKPMATEHYHYSDIPTADIPVLSGYIGTTAKEHAEVILESPKGDPIFISAEYGKGKVWSLTTDLQTDWSGEWLTSENGRKLILDIFNEATVIVPKCSFDVSGDFTADTCHITVSGNLPDDAKYIRLEGNLVGDSKNTVLTPVMTGNGVYECDFPFSQTGSYMVKVTVKDKSGNISEICEKVFQKGYQKEYNIFGKNGETLIASMSSIRNGNPEDLISASENETVEYKFTPLIPLMVFSLVLLIADIAIRKLRLKDIKEFLGIGNVRT